MTDPQDQSHTGQDHTPQPPDAEREFSLAAAYRELQNLLLDGSDLTALLGRVAALAAAVVPGSSCGITMRRDREVSTVASSDSFADQVDEIQYGRGQGPCLDALHHGEEVYAETWPPSTGGPNTVSTP